MNLSLTPLSEAYNSPKLKPKTKQNIYTNPQHQKEVLNESNLEVQTQMPSGYSNVLEQQTIIPITNNEKKSLVVKITDDELIEMLSPYKEDYVSAIIKKNMQKRDNTEFFQNTSDNFMSEIDIKLLLGVLILLVVVDIIIRLKLKL
jgi:hypothetical protein